MGPIGRLLPFHLTLAETSPACRRRAERAVSLLIVAGVLGSGGALLTLLTPRLPEAGGNTPAPLSQLPAPVDMDRRLSQLERRVTLLEARLGRAEGAHQRAELR